MSSRYAKVVKLMWTREVQGPQDTQDLPVPMQENNRSWQSVIIVYDELEVSHGFIPLVLYGPMQRTLCKGRVIYLIYDVRNVAQVDIKP
jgi:hypothetical protein